MKATHSTIKKMITGSLLGLLTLSCGKGFNEPESDETVYTPITSANIELEVTHIEPISYFITESNGFFRIPNKIELIEGDHENRVIYLSFNVREKAEFYCIYQGFGDSFSFDDCYNPEQTSLGLRPGDLVPQALDHAVEMELESNQTNAGVRAKVTLNFDVR